MTFRRLVLQILTKNMLVGVLRLACTLIGEISIPLFYSTRALLRSIHIVESVAPDSDVSFSLPHFPHSIFLSIPPSDNSDAVPRLAESIIHEVMHLQLSLVERIYPLTLHNADLEHAYSPWLNIRRPIDGIIHGLFVFRALEDFWSQVCVAKRNGVLEFAENRVEDINNQCSVIKPKKYESLTRFGQDLFLRLAKPRKIALS